MRQVVAGQSLPCPARWAGSCRSISVGVSGIAEIVDAWLIRFASISCDRAGCVGDGPAAPGAQHVQRRASHWTALRYHVRATHAKLPPLHCHVVERRSSSPATALALAQALLALAAGRHRRHRVVPAARSTACFGAPSSQVWPARLRPASSASDRSSRRTTLLEPVILGVLPRVDASGFDVSCFGVSTSTGLPPHGHATAR